MLSSTACPENSGKSRHAGKTLLQTLFFFLLVTQICFAQWVQLGLNYKSVKNIAARNSNIFAITSDIGTVFRSTDNGINWSQIIDSSAVDIAIAPTGNVFMIRKFPPHQLYNINDSLFISSDNGNNWINLDIINQLSSLPQHSPTNVTICPSGILYCGIGYRDKYMRTVTTAISTNDGSIWTLPQELVQGGDLFDFIAGNVITAGYEYAIDAGGCYISLSSDDGQTWTILGNSGFEYNTILKLCGNGNIIMGGSFSPYDLGLIPGLILSRDSCKTWLQVSTLNPEVGLSIESGSLLIGADSLGIFLFSDNGDSLGSFNEGLSNLNAHTLSMDNNFYVYVGTDNGVWKRPLSEITSVEDLSIDLPSNFNLSQNFPNPFNPSTKISWQLPVGGNATLKVYDILGREVVTLVNEHKTAGKYETKFNAATLPSGVYFYKLNSEDYTSVKKMLLLK